VNIICHTAFADPGATAADTCAGTLTVTVTGSVNPNAVGSYTLTYSATDPSGNKGSATRTVSVVDTTPPVVTLNGSDPMTVWFHAAFTDPGATAADTCAGTLPITVTGSVDTNTVGSYVLTYWATDPSGNTGSATRTVNVLDNQVRLTILLTPTNTVVVAWPSPSLGYVLQQSMTLDTIDWANTTNTVHVVGDQNQAWISPPPEKCFYRLFHP
jgi:hypothetical protein